MIYLTEEQRLNNIKLSMARDIPWMESYKLHGGRWNVCAGGPGLRKEIPRIKKAKGVIVSVNGTHDYLLNKGVKPDYFILTDPREHNARFVHKPRRDVIYLIAAHCDPKVFDALTGFDCRLWFPLDYELPVPVSVGGGSTVGLRAINVGFTLGYPDIHLWGFDGCVKEHHHAYPQPENDDEPTEVVEYRGKKFKMTEWMIHQAANFDEMMRKHSLNITVHTNGVIKHIGDYYAS
jgi:uncharacterized Rossmann fold enzyme